jgi:hypothetical protein
MRRWEDKPNIRMYLILRCGLDTSGSGSDPVVGLCEQGNELSGCIKLISSLTGRLLASQSGPCSMELVIRAVLGNIKKWIVRLVISHILRDS